MAALSLPISAGASLSADPAAARSDELLRAWQRVHERLLNPAGALPGPLAEASAAVVYQLCVAAAFGRAADAALAHQQYAQLAGRLEQQPAAVTEPLVALAWLQRQLAPVQPAGFAGLQRLLLAQDQLLLEEALALPATLAHQPRFLGIIRYFSLRLPNARAEASVRQLLAHRAQWPLAEGPRPLGLPDGQAGELLLLLRLQRQGVVAADLRQAVREGIVRLLAQRRSVDFQAGQYSVFPDQLDEATGEACFSAQLSWHHGDLAQVWLLYAAHELLQDTELARIAELVGLNTLLRTSQAATGVVSSAFSQGAAGVATLYRRLHQVSGHPAYWQGYQQWLTQTCRLVERELAAPPDPTTPPAGSISHGLLGVGLVLLSALAEQELHWEAILL